MKSSSTNYEVEHFLGRGVYGKVMKCKNHDTGETVAIKVVKSEPDDTTQEGTEAEILSKLTSADADKHNIVRFYESFMHDNRLCLVFEMLPLSLRDFQQKKPLPLGHIRPIIKQLATALVKLKSLGLIHADLKPENIMMVEPVKPPYHIKVIDFGLACHTSNPTSILQSMWYRSPEVILGLPVDEAIDMWSLGCITAELFTGWPLYPSHTEYDQIRYIVKTQGLPHEDMLNAGVKTIFYFNKGSGSKDPMWRLKKKPKCTSGTGDQSKVFRQGGIRSFRSLFNVNMPKPDTADFLLEMKDRVIFLNLMNKMLTLDPKKRISPEQVFQHSFITMNHIMHYPLYNGISNNQQAAKQDFSHIKSSDDVVQLCPSARPHMSDKIVQISVENGSTQRIAAVDQTHAVGHEIQTQNTNPSKHRTEQNEHKKPRGTKRSASWYNFALFAERISCTWQWRSVQEVRCRIFMKSSSTNYEVEHFLGRGVYGKVMKCKNHDTGETVAIKVVKSEPDDTTQEGTEAEILSKLTSADADKHNIVRFYESFMHDNRLCLVFEMLPLSLRDFQQKKPLPLGHIRPIIKQLATALVKLKSLGLIHADLKPENIMMVEPVKPPYHIKVIDFGLACHTSNPTSILQSMWYRSPEVILGLPVDEAIDMWSLGCIMAELFTGWPLYPSHTEYDQIRYIVKTQGLPHEDMLNAGVKTIFYFNKGSGSKDPMWRLKKKPKCTSGTGDQSKVFRQGGIRSFRSLFNVNMPKPDTADFLLEMKDRVIFLNLMNKMLTLDPKKRISPEQVFQHSFITMNHIMHYPLYNGISNNQQAAKQDFSHIKSSDDVVQLCPSARPHMSDKIVQISVENGSTQRIAAVDQTHAVGHEIQTQNTNPSKHRTEQNEHKKPRGTKRSASSMDTQNVELPELKHICCHKVKEVPSLNTDPSKTRVQSTAEIKKGGPSLHREGGGENGDEEPGLETSPVATVATRPDAGPGPGRSGGRSGQRRYRQ
ncbi:uncharacterized protein LOC114770640 [Denticeps clupeoides]|uniref:uncharacterized protein LOC114770640 n=1 Tax=Denticeps clupeoides TaxID=299321 RepID=UPI0010A48EAF|nr:uncharacterized protein LOC114770640 [Denticeps clupeoides]